MDIIERDTMQMDLQGEKAKVKIYLKGLSAIVIRIARKDTYASIRIVCHRWMILTKTLGTKW